MKNTTIFDVLIVYTHGIAKSAANPTAAAPFSDLGSRKSYNIAYGYFLQMCAKYDLKAAFTTTIDMNDDASFKSYWTFSKNKWTKVNKNCKSHLIFDKFAPISNRQKERREILFSNPRIKSFNSPRLFPLFLDKLQTYQNLKDFTIPTVALEDKTKKGIEQAILELKVFKALHPNESDFSDDIVVKDRFGAGGNFIFSINKINQAKKIFDILEKYKNTSFVLQPFANFKDGWSYKKYSGFIDIRIIYLKTKIVQVYIRNASKNDFRCNEHQGGRLEYIPLKDIPKKVINFSAKVTKTLNEKTSLFALDYVISKKGNVYLMEGNNGPGLDWNVNLKKNELESKKLIRLIVSELSRRSKANIAILPQFEDPTIPLIY